MAGGRIPQPDRPVFVGTRQEPAVWTECHIRYPAGDYGQHTLLLCQQGGNGRLSLLGGGYPPGCHCKLPGGDGVSRIEVEAFRGQLAGQRDRMLPGGDAAGPDREAGRSRGSDGQGEEAGDQRARRLAAARRSAALAARRNARPAEESG